MSHVLSHWRGGMGAFGRAAAAMLLAVALAACSSAGMLAGAPAGAPAGEGAAPGQFGSGPRVLGVMAFAEPGNLSDGASDSIVRAARLAAGALTGNPVTVLVRTVATAADAAAAATEFAAAEAGIVIGLDDAATALQVAKALLPGGTPTISLTSFSDLAYQLYGAGFVANEEAVALVNELARRGHASIAVVSTQGRASQDFTKAVLGLAASAGIAARPVDGSTDSQFLAGMSALADAGVAPSAIVFASGPERAAAMRETLRAEPRFKSVALVGNAGWSLAPKLPAALKGAWYTRLADAGLGDFAARFSAANGGAATLNAAMTYDLIVLAAALPQAIEEEPYHPEILTNPQGFKGFTGPFRFGPNGMLAARRYEIVAVK